MLASEVTTDTDTDLPDGLPKQDNRGFSSQIDFTIVNGVSGGPSWSLTKFKGPGGGSAGGSGASGSSGSGGGGQGPLNFNSTAKDTLIISFAAVRAGTSPATRAKQASSLKKLADANKALADYVAVIDGLISGIAARHQRAHPALTAHPFATEQVQQKLDSGSLQAEALASQIEDAANAASQLPEGLAPVEQSALDRATTHVHQLASIATTAQREHDEAEAEAEAAPSTNRASAYQAADAGITRLLLQNIQPAIP